MNKIIDSHTHIYPDKIAEKASQSIADFYEMPVKYDGTVGKLIEICRRNNIVNCVACSVATSAERVSVINEYLAEIVSASEGFFIGLCALHPALSESQIDSELSKAEARGFKGIKIHPDFQQFEVDSPKAYKIYERAEGRLPILFHTGDKRYNYSNPARLARVLNMFPKLMAVGAHFGGWSEWGDVKCLAGFENLYVDTSSSLYAISSEQARELIQVFGEERVMFGTDYPMWDADGELEFIERLNLSEEAKESILYENVKRLYSL
ncbi:MAG: amidohydrolase family protein [Oscillospiraceae bacterium]|nr:amidohydrolase family protein [Oscillospiraceae bacterium]